MSFFVIFAHEDLDQWFKQYRNFISRYSHALDRSRGNGMVKFMIRATRTNMWVWKNDGSCTGVVDLPLKQPSGNGGWWVVNRVPVLQDRKDGVPQKWMVSRIGRTVFQVHSVLRSMCWRVIYCLIFFGINAKSNGPNLLLCWRIEVVALQGWHWDSQLCFYWNNCKNACIDQQSPLSGSFSKHLFLRAMSHPW